MASSEIRANTWSETLEQTLDKLEQSEVPVLIQGETGSGKEVVARAIHARSARRNGTFLKLNCAALPAELAESELFGYERGAFTGAFQNTPGKFELADRGTILLDEIGDMELRLQAKLLQVLQDQEYLPLGARKTRKVNVRLIAATHRDLQAFIAEGRFRADLYYRLDVIKIAVPPLRERREEIVKIAHDLVKKHTPAGAEAPVVTPALERALVAFDWPGNVRQLENTVRRLVAYGDADMIAEDLWRSQAALSRSVSESETPANIIDTSSLAVENSRTALERIREERQREEVRIFTDALIAEHWNRKRAATRLHLEYKAFLYRMKKLGITDLACA